MSYSGPKFLSILCSRLFNEVPWILVPLHDFDGLRELCGCLIRVEHETTLSSSSSIVLLYEPRTISSAHYTVKEYLQSSRISQKKVEFFALDREKIQKRFAEIAIHQALAIQLGWSANNEDTRDHMEAAKIQSILDEDFKIYYGASSVAQLYIWPEVISSDATLMEHSRTLVGPSRLAYGELVDLLYMVNGRDIASNNSDLDPELQFWAVIWTQEPDPDLAVFLAFLLLSAFYSTPHLAISFTGTHPMLAILTQQLYMEKEVWHIREMKNLALTSSKGRYLNWLRNGHPASHIPLS